MQVKNKELHGLMLETALSASFNIAGIKADGPSVGQLASSMAPGAERSSALEPSRSPCIVMPHAPQRHRHREDSGSKRKQLISGSKSQEPVT